MVKTRSKGIARQRAAQAPEAPATVEPGVELGEDGVIICDGPWTLPYLQSLERRLARLEWPDARGLVCDTSGLTALDTGGAVLLHRTIVALRRRGREIALEGLAPEFADLLAMVSEHWGRMEPQSSRVRPSWVERIGRLAWDRLRGTGSGLAFLGESVVVLGRLVFSPSAIRWRVLAGSLQRDGFNALPIIGLLTLLMGIVIAYQGAAQLRSVGANIFVVDLVGISLLREIAPLVTAILMAGRSGSAFTAQIGTMRVTEELDALRTLGLQPMQVLVIPKVLALVVALPLLTVYADVVGVFGGMLIAVSQLGVTFNEFLTRFEEAVEMKHFLIGLSKAPVFAVIIALVGSHQGFRIRGGVDDVGRHTTISVVQSIFLVIVYDAFFSILLSWWNL